LRPTVAPSRTLTQRELNRAVLARQGLLSGHSAPLPRVLERVCGIQAQYAPSMYVGLWSRMPSFARSDLDEALARRKVVQATLMRITIHLVAPKDYWPFAIATRESRRALWLRARRGASTEAAMQAAAEKVRTRVAEGPVTRRELDALVGRESASGVGLWIDLVRVPPAGTWERRRADVFGDAADWVGPPPALSPAEAAAVLVRRYLAAFGPASRADVVSFTGLPASVVSAALETLTLRHFGDLVDVPRAPLPDPATEAPVRFLPTWDATLLVHCRRAGILREEHRPLIFTTKNPQSTATFLVDGTVAGTWRLENDRVEATPFGPMPAPARKAIEEEAERLTELHA
jgi:hypothetical protein